MDLCGRSFSWLGCYGDAVNQGGTPHIDSIAEQGVLFERAFAPAPVCSATRSAVIVGQSAIRFGAHQHRSSRKGTPIYLPDGYTILPQLMLDAATRRLIMVRRIITLYGIGRPIHSPYHRQQILHRSLISSPFWTNPDEGWKDEYRSLSSGAVCFS